MSGPSSTTSGNSVLGIAGFATPLPVVRPLGGSPPQLPPPLPSHFMCENIISRGSQAEACDNRCVIRPCPLFLPDVYLAAAMWGRRQCRRSTRRLLSRDGDLRAGWRVPFSLFLFAVFFFLSLLLCGFPSLSDSSQPASTPLVFLSVTIFGLGY